MMSKDAFYKAEAQAFVDAHPEYTPTPENHERIFARLNEKNLDLTRANLELVWKELSAEETIQ